MSQFHTYGLKVTVAGQNLRESDSANLVSASVDEDVNLPGAFELRFRQPHRELLDDSTFTIGAEVTVSAKAGGEFQKIITGEVTAIEVEIASNGSTVLVRGLEKSHRLFRGRTVMAYNNMTYSDVARKVASRAGLAVGTVDSHTVVHPQVCQAAQSDWDFLSHLAAEIGYEVRCTEGKLDFRKPVAASAGGGAAPALIMGENLRRLRGAVTAAEQVAKVEVRGWDPQQKKVVVGSKPTANRAVGSSVKANQLGKKFGAPDHIVAHSAYATQAEVDAAAAAIAERIADTCMELEGVADGDPALRAGKPVAVKDVGGPFDGTHVLTRVRHCFDDDGYSVAFSVNGHQDRTLLGLTSTGSNSRTAPLAGVVSALVTNVNDDKKQGRVKLKFPWLADDYETGWARVAQAGAGKNRGSVVLPEVNDEVLVAFEHGDVARPYVVGGLYNGTDLPKLGEGIVDAGTGKVTRRGFISLKDHHLIFFDGDKKSGVAVATAGGMRIALNDTKKTIHIVSSGKLEIESEQDVSVTTKGNATVKAQRNVSVEAQANAAVKAGGSLELAAKGSLKVQSDGVVEIKGSLVKIN